VSACVEASFTSKAQREVGASVCGGGTRAGAKRVSSCRRSMLSRWRRLLVPNTWGFIGFLLVVEDSGNTFKLKIESSDS
jgi:hypothetical protein